MGNFNFVGGGGGVRRCWVEYVKLPSCGEARKRHSLKFKKHKKKRKKSSNVR